MLSLVYRALADLKVDSDAFHSGMGSFIWSMLFQTCIDLVVSSCRMVVNDFVTYTSSCMIVMEAEN